MKIALVLLAALCSAGVPVAQNPTPASLLVLSKRDQTLAIVDPLSLQVVSKVPVGNDPHEVIASADGSTAYVSNYGSGAYHTLAVVDLIGRRALPSIDLGPLSGPHGLSFVGGKLWFTAEGAKAIGRYDPAEKRVDWVLGTGQNRTHMIYVAADGQHIVTTNVSSGTVSLIDKEPLRMPSSPPGMPPPGAAPGPGGAPPGGGNGPGGPGPRTDWNEVVVRVGDGSEGFDVSPDGHQIWVANARDGTISIIDLASKSVIQTLSANVRGANRLKFTPDGTRVLVSSLGGPDLVVLDARTREEIKRVPIGHGAAGIVIEPGGARAFVACTPDNYVAVIDLGSLTVVGHILAGEAPDGLAWAIRG
jgi:YVTN family beta-propeller protein